MGKVIKNSLRFLLVTVGIVVLTSLGIDATDALRGSNSALSSLVQNSIKATCPEGMAEVSLGERHFCIDQYEVSPYTDCPMQIPNSALDTKLNLGSEDCWAESVPKQLPWVQVTFHQAKELCAAREMRLPTSLEWYEAALGTPDTDACNIGNGSLQVAGSGVACVSARGVYDMIGNVWEWVDEEISEGIYNARPVPQQGYVTEADMTGIAAATSDTPNDLYNNDYFWSDQVGNYTLLRGGFYGSGEDAGIYSAHLKTSPSFSSGAIGFRCVFDL